MYTVIARNKIILKQNGLEVALRSIALQVAQH